MSYILKDEVEILFLSDSGYDYWWHKESPDKSKMLVYRSPANPDNVLSFNLAELKLHSADYNASNGSISNTIKLTTNFTRDHDSSFSPNGKQIVFSAGNVAYTNVNIAIYDMESQEESKLVNDTESNGSSMCWSTDSKEIYFHSLNLTQNPFQIKKVNTSSKEVVTLLSAAPEDFGYYHPEIA